MQAEKKSFTERYARAVIRGRIPIIIIVVLVSAGFGAALPSIYADDDVMQFLPQDDPDVELFRRVNKRFGGLDVAIVGLEADSMFTAENLLKVRDLTREIARIDGVFDVMSFTEVPDAQPAPDGLRVTPLVMDRVPSKPEELAELKKRVLANENAVGNLISPDGKAAMILCFLGDTRPPMHIAGDIKDVARGIWDNDSIYYGGSPFIRHYVAGGTKEDLKWLTPIVAGVVLLVTFLIFRKPLGVLLALGTVAIALAWMMGIVALRGRGLTLVGSSLPTILMAIGGAYGIHILAGYFAGKSDNVPDRIVEGLKNVAAPVAASAATTCAGFLSFLVMDMEPLRDFGVFASIGVGFTAVLSLTFIPAVLSFSKRVPRSLGSTLLAKPLGRLGMMAQRRRTWALVVAGVLAVAGVFGVLRIAPDATLETFFSKGSEPDKANRFLDRNFGGSVYLQVYFEGDMRNPFVLAQLRKVVEYARGMDEVEQVNSIIDPLTMMSEAMGGRADLPVNNRRTGALYPFLEGTAAIDQIVAPEKDASLVQIRLKDIGPEQVDSAVKRMRAFIDAEVPRGIKVVRIGEFVDPSDRDEFFYPEEVDDQGRVVKEAEPLQIAEPKDEADLSRRKNQMRNEVAGRIIRLARIYGEPTVGKEGRSRIVDLLAGDRSVGDLEPGEDLQKAVAAVIEEHIGGEVPAFEEPFEDASAQEQAEWRDRTRLVIEAVTPSERGILNVEKVKVLVSGAMPLTSARDPEGLELTAAALASGISQARANVRASRIAGPALALLGIDRPSDDLSTRVAWAITDIDMPVLGFPDAGKNASTVLARVTGQPVINVAMCNSTISNQLKSLALALVVLAVIMSVFFRSVMTALKGLVPAVFMLAVAVGVMGAAAIPLDLTTSMIAAIALGIGVDYSIHFLWRRKRRGETLLVTTSEAGPSIASNAVQVAAGFAVLSLSDQVPLQRFGLLVALTMLLSAAATFVLLPALRAEGSEATATEEEEETENGSVRV